MDLKQLEYFTAIADEGSISAAARKLYMSQPPLSSQLKQLETELGCTLFERTSRSMHLTPAGRTLYQYALSLLHLRKVAVQDTMFSARQYNGTVRIGIISSVICSDALSWLQAFHVQHPDICFDIVEGNTFSLLNELENHTVHFALLRTPFNQGKLNCHTILSDELLAIGQPAFFQNCQSRDGISLQELAALPLISFRRWQPLIQDAFTNAGHSVTWRCINDDARTTLYLVEAGMGVGIAPASTLALLRDPSVCSRPVTDCRIRSDVVVAKQNDTILPACAASLYDFLLQLPS